MSQGTKKLVFMLISLLAAIVLWLYVVTIVSPESTITVSAIPISIDGTMVLEERGLIVTAQDVAMLNMNLSASRVNLTKLNAESIRVNADASRIRAPGKFALTCSVTFPDTVRSSEVDILRKSVDSVTITVERLDRKTVPIELDWTGKVREGYLLEAESAVLEPDSVTVYGPESDVSRIAKAVVNYDVSDLVDTTVEILPVVFLDENGETVELSGHTVVSPPEASMTIPVVRSKKITLAVDLKEGGGVTAENAEVTLDVETIRVKGAAQVIDALDDTLVLGTIDLASVTNGEELSFDLVLPVGVTNVGGEEEIKAKVRLFGVTTDEISVSDIRLINEPAGYHTELSTRTVRVKVRGSTEEIREIKSNPANGIYIQVDLADYSQIGAFTVSGQVVNESHPAVSAAETVEIGVEISAAAPVPES